MKRNNYLNWAVHATLIDTCTITLCLWAGCTRKTNSSFGFGMKCVDKPFKCATFSKPRNQSNFICNRIGEAFLPCFGWLKGETGTADNRIFCIESRLMLNKIIKIPFKCSDLCIRRFTNVSSGEILPSKEWSLGRTSKNPVVNVFIVSLQKNSLSSWGLE